MLTFEIMLLCTALLLAPVFIAFRNMLQQRDSMFLQMLLGYTVCYFMKNFYALVNRAVNGIENDGLEMDLIAMLGTIFFLIAAEFCLCHLSEGCKSRKGTSKGAAGALENQILFIACYLVSVFCIYAVTIKTRTKAKDAKKF